MWQKFKAILTKVKDWLLLSLTLILLVVVILLMNKCGDILNKSKQGDNDTITVYKHRTDTIRPDTQFVYKFKYKKVPVPQVVTDTFWKSIDTINCKRIYIYKDSLVDSNLVLYYKATVQGALRDFEPSYRLKVPLKIIDSVRIDRTIKIKPKFELYGGLTLSKGIIAPMGEVGLKRFKIGLGYNLNSVNKGPVIGISYKLYSK